jgi:hypothetical protein
VDPPASVASGLFSGGPDWADTDPNPPTTADLQLVKILTDLTSASATAKLAADPASPGFDPGDDTIYKQIDRLQTQKMPYAGGTFTGAVTFDVQPVCKDPNVLGLEARTIRRVSKNVIFLPSASLGSWTISGTGTAIQGALALTYACVTLDPPIDQKITEVYAIVKGGAGKLALPGTMPQIELWKVKEDGTVDLIASAVDATASLPAYEAAHQIRITGLNEYVALDTRFLLKVRGEDASTIAGLEVLLGSFKTEVTSLPAGD